MAAGLRVDPGIHPPAPDHGPVCTPIPSGAIQELQGGHSATRPPLSPAHRPTAPHSLPPTQRPTAPTQRPTAPAKRPRPLHGPRTAPHNPHTAPHGPFTAPARVSHTAPHTEPHGPRTAPQGLRTAPSTAPHTAPHGPHTAAAQPRTSPHSTSRQVAPTGDRAHLAAPRPLIADADARRLDTRRLRRQHPAPGLASAPCGWGGPTSATHRPIPSIG